MAGSSVKPRKQLLKALADVGVTEDDWRTIERARHQVDLVNARLVGRDAGVMYAVTCVPREPVARKVAVEHDPVLWLQNNLNAIGGQVAADLNRAVKEPHRRAPTLGVYRFLAAQWIEERDAEVRDREMWLQGVKRRLGIIEHGDDREIRAAQWLADHPGNPGLVPQLLLEVIRGL